MTDYEIRYELENVSGIAVNWNYHYNAPSRVLVAPEPSREAITRAQEKLAEYPQEDLPPEHYFAPGMYGRRLDIPKDTYVVGKIHKHQHIVMLMAGVATINTDRGMERITGPCIWISPDNAKRILYTHTDCAFFTCHLNPTDITDLDELEAALIEPEKELLE